MEALRAPPPAPGPLKQPHKLPNVPTLSTRTQEYSLVEALKARRVTKPVVAWVSGTCARLFTSEVQFGHAGAKSGGEAESAQVRCGWGRPPGLHLAPCPARRSLPCPTPCPGKPASTCMHLWHPPTPAGQERGPPGGGGHRPRVLRGSGGGHQARSRASAGWGASVPPQGSCPGRTRGSCLGGCVLAPGWCLPDL